MANIGTTNTPSISWGPLGPQAPSGPAILAGVQADYNVAFSVSFNWAGSTPQGQLASSQSAALNYYNQVMVFYATQSDPAFAQGRMQDAIARIYFLTRNPPEATVLQVSCSGSQVTIPAGPSSFGTITDAFGNLYQCTGAAALPPGGGSITLSFACTVPGPVPVPNTVKIFQAIPGWDSATVISGVVGTNAETSQQFELRRGQSVAANARNTNDAILGAVLSVSGVLDAYVIDNPSNATLTVGGFTLAARSIYVAAFGGAAAAVAQAIWTKKPPGIPMNGNTSVAVTDQNPAYSPPFPSYTILFQTPSVLPVYFIVNIANSPLVPSNAIMLVQAAIVNAFNGANQGASFTGSISGNILSVTSVVPGGTIAVGQALSGANVVPGTTIAGLVTGAGNAGTYTVSIPQNVPATSLTTQPVSNLPVPPKARIGSTIYANQYAAVVAALGSWAAVRTILVGSANSAGGVMVGWIAGTTLTVVAVTSGTLAVGQWISGFDATSGISIGTQITAFGSGAGGVGTYTINNTQTVAGATFTGTGAGTTLTASGVTGTIAIGDVITGTGVPTGTTIVSQISGTPGGAGNYQTSLATTSAGASLVANISITAVPANQNLVAVGIAQEPAINAANVAVTVT